MRHGGRDRTTGPFDDAKAAADPADAIAGNSPAIEEVLAQARCVAVTDSTVLVLGETGTGKELIASYVHAHSRRHHREMIRVNCAAIPSTLIEVPADNMAALQRYPWPGNIRELRNAVERAMIQTSGPRLRIAVPTPLSVASLRSQRLVDVQKDHIRKVLETSGWRVRGAAERLGLAPTTLETRMARLGLNRPRRAVASL